MKKLISIVNPCYNEMENVEKIHEVIKDIFSQLPGYEWEQIFIDNASEDGTVEILRDLAKKDDHVKVILNSRNFGHIRSPYHGMTQAGGDAVILMATDFQDPPELIIKFIEKWEEGNKVVLGVKSKSRENPLFFAMRRVFYHVAERLSDVRLIKNFTGYGLYDKDVINVMRQIDDPYPYLRGLICEIGFRQTQIEFIQPKRSAGITKNNLYTLFDMAMLGFTSYSKIPLRLAIWLGMFASAFSFLIAMIYLVYKLMFWDQFSVGIAPLVIGLFLFVSVQLFFLGIVGEYVGMIFTQVQKRPRVIESERINFKG